MLTKKRNLRQGKAKIRKMDLKDRRQETKKQKGWMNKYFLVV